jgi:uncharacterized protein
MTARLLGNLARSAQRRPRLVIAIAVVLGLGAGAFALRLKPTAATSTFVSSSSSQYAATQTFYKGFGEEPIAVLVQGNLQQLVLSSDIERLVGLEGCLSGKVPSAGLAREGGRNGPCGQLGRAGTVKVVFGPGTFIAEAASRIDEEIAGQTAQANAQAKQSEKVFYEQALKKGYSRTRAHALGAQAGKVVLARFKEGLVTTALQYGLSSTPSITDANFVSDLVFDSSKGAGIPKQRFAYLFPSPDTALISVRMRAGLSQQAKNHTIALIRRAVAMPQWQLTHGESYLITGEPVIVSDLTASITHSIELLLLAVLLVMAATLGLIFGGRPRLLPLALALLSTALTFGALSLAGSSLTVAAVAVLPVLIGLSVDYAIQFQSRVGEALADPVVAGADPESAIVHAAVAGGPTIVTAAAASAAATLVLLLSPVPMVRGFGALLVLGVAIALLCTVLAGSAALALVPGPSVSGRRLAKPLAEGRFAASWRGAGELLRENPLTRLLGRVALVGAVRRPERVLALGLLLALLGWGLDTQTRVETDITKLVPQNLSSLQALDTLEHDTGVGGEIALLLSGPNLTSPATIEWMTTYQRSVLARFGYSATRGCGKAELCPAFSLPDLFANTPGEGAQSAKLNQSNVDGLLRAIPPYFSQDVISSDRREATLAFGIRQMSLERQQSLVEQMRSRLHPPSGVSAQLVGLPVLAAQSGSQVADPWRRLETLLAGLLAVGAVLMVAFRGDRRRALVPLVPIVMATGWSALVLYAVRVPLNPMSVTLGALVIAISTEFSVLLSERHRQEMLHGHDVIEALRRSYGRTGAAVAASGVTAIAGFGVLVLSDIRMLRDFGLVTLIDLSVSLVGVLVALPAVLVLVEQHSAKAQGTTPTRTPGFTAPSAGPSHGRA